MDLGSARKPFSALSPITVLRGRAPAAGAREVSLRPADPAMARRMAVPQRPRQGRVPPRSTLSRPCRLPSARCPWPLRGPGPDVGVLPLTLSPLTRGKSGSEEHQPAVGTVGARRGGRAGSLDRPRFRPQRTAGYLWKPLDFLAGRERGRTVPPAFGVAVAGPGFEEGAHHGPDACVGVWLPRVGSPSAGGKGGLFVRERLLS